MPANRQIVIRELPEGTLTEAHFELSDTEMPVVASGQILIRSILMSMDAANRAWMQGATYRDAVKAGDAMPTQTIGEVMESTDSAFKAGDIVISESQWAGFVAVSAKGARKVPASRPLSHHMSVFGIAGKTAYHGLLGVGRPQQGETVVVSAAAGSVGMFVGQIAKASGCRAVGIAGGAEKCRWVVDELGFDACIDYRSKNFFRELKATCPGGIDVYFDNVGGTILETALFQMNMKGRVVCCGAVSQYNATEPSGPRNVPGMIVVKRIRMEGFIVMDFAADDAKAQADLERWVSGGQIKVFEDIIEGLENAPGALTGLLGGDNRGKRLVRVSPDPA